MSSVGSLRFTFSVIGEKQIDRTMLRWSQRASDFAPVFEVVADYWMKIEEEQFATDGARSGEPWAPLKEATVKAKQARGLDPRIMRATLALYNSLTQRGDPNQLLVITPSTLAFGTHLPYAEPHQRPRDGAALPRRRLIDFTEADKVATVKALQFWVVRGKVVSPLAAKRALNTAIREGGEL